MILQTVLSSSDSWVSPLPLSLLVRIFLFTSIFTVLLDLGSAYGTAKSGVGICSMGVLKPQLILRSVVPVIMAGILGVYGLIVGVVLA